MHKLNKVFLSLIIILFYGQIFAQDKIDPVKFGARALQIEDKSVLALTFENQEKWHTYWKNPGDAGTEIKVAFRVNNQEADLKAYAWPKPKRYIEQGNLWAYGYSHNYALFFDLPLGLKGQELEIKGEWLVCKDICIPGGKVIRLKLDDQLSGSNNPTMSDESLRDEFSKLPIDSPAAFTFYLNKAEGENQLALNYVIENADFSQISDKESIVYPYLQFPFDYKHEELYLDRKNNLIYGRMLIDWDGIYEEPIMELPSDGVFKEPIRAKFLVNYPKDQKAKRVDVVFKQFSLTGDTSLTKIMKNLETPSQKSKVTNEVNKDSLLLILLFGFLGGLILNLMPCVLPVISLKLFGLIAHRDEGKTSILRHNLAYTAGVISSFLILGAVVVFLKSSGAKIGWGFQLQSPLFVFAMLIFIFVLALNMFGLFEFVTPGGRTLGNKELKKGFAGDFVNGIIAVILSTPCSAPFLGTALTYAFTTSSLNVFLVFSFIGLGLAFPFILTGFFPSLIKFLPKPGAWMEKLKNILGLTLLLTVVWLYDVMDGLIDMEFSGLYLNSILVLTFFAFFLRQKISRNKFINVIAFALPIILLGQTIQMGAFRVSSSEARSRTSGVKWDRWSQQSMVNTPGPVFINFTAKWCITCKVNKKIVLESDGFSDLIAQNNIKLLEGDWTKRDEEITEFLQSYGIVGVPAYFVKTKSGEIKNLGETISLSKIKEALK